MRESYNTIKRRMHYSKYDNGLPSFPSHRELSLADDVMHQSQKWIFHHKHTITSKSGGTSLKLGKYACQKSCIVLLIIRTDVVEM